MFGLLEALAGKGFAAALWIVGGVVGAYTLFVGVTLGVALFHSDPRCREHARLILRDLLALFRFRDRGK